jgi:N-acetyl-gamma-glutamyl-phosphate reductase
VIRAGVVGATGYVGSELVRWLLGHPELRVVAAASTSQAGAPLAEAVPGLAGLTDLVLEPVDPARLAALDVVFLATPHGAARALAEALSGAPRIVDCSADHRHAPGWVYGLPELGAPLAGARRIAAPGCFATAVALATGPLVAAGGVRGPLCVSGLTGSTGSGATPGAGTHHPERFATIRPYKVLTHQHVPEIRAALAALGVAPALHFVPHSAPLDRGILATAFVPFDGDPVAAFSRFYADRPLIRLRSSPEKVEVRLVRGTAFADVAVAAGEGLAVSVVAIDNLGKGAAAQAVQAANLALGLPEALGLRQAPATP